MEPENLPNQTQAQSPFLVPFSIIIAGALIGAGIYFSKTAPPRQNTGQSTVVEDIEIAPVTESDHILGNPNADVMIVEFSDTECPYCKTYHNTLKRIIDEYGSDGKVAWVYRHFPIKELHSKAPKEAEATECAAELGGNGKFWEYINTIFLRTPSNNGLDPAELNKIARDIGLDESKFTKCLDSGKYASEVQRDYQDAVRSGGLGTPHTVVISPTGEKVTIKGAQTYEFVKAVIDVALGQ